MADFPFSRAYTLCQTENFDLATSTAVDYVTTTGGDNPWQEITASVDEDCVMLHITHTANTSGSITYIGLNISIGEVGAEDASIIIPNLMFHGKPNALRGPLDWFLRVDIPKGSRVSYSVNADNANRTISLGFRFYAGGFQSPEGFSEYVSYGFNNRNGVDIDPGTTANTKGAWFEIESNSDELKEFYLNIGSSQNNAQANADFLIDVGARDGATGDYQVIEENIYRRTSTAESFSPAELVEYEVPAGSSIAARCQSSITDSSDRVISVSITGAK